MPNSFQFQLLLATTIGWTIRYQAQIITNLSAKRRGPCTGIAIG